MTIYRHDIIWAVSGHVVHLRYVESIIYKALHEGISEEEKLIDKLAGRSILIIRSGSGKEYEISLEQTLTDNSDTVSTTNEMALAIVHKWSSLKS